MDGVSTIDHTGFVTEDLVRAEKFYAKLFDASGVPYPELLERLVELALERRERRAKLQY